MLAVSSIGVINKPEDHASDLIAGGFFFAMRSCKYSKSKRNEKNEANPAGGS